MYGLVNKALRDMVIMNHGVPAWEAIQKRAGIVAPEFVSMEPYPDSITYGLAQAAADHLGVPLDQVLEGFGEYWVLYTAQEGYGEMLGLCGQSLAEFLGNMDQLHSRIRIAFPLLAPPKLTVSDVTARGLKLHYRSSRPGLAPMVVGLVKGLGTRLGTRVEVRHVESKTTGADHDVFDIQVAG